MELLDGKIVREVILDKLWDKLSKIDKKLSFVVIEIGNVNSVYINSKRKLALELGYSFNHIKLDDNVSNQDVIDVINKYNMDNDIDGIMVELPIPSGLDYDLIRNSINPDKDIDGVTDVNIGKVVTLNDGIMSCTSKGIIYLLDYYNIDISSKNVVIVGRSSLVGKPLFNKLIDRDATVTVCHSKTKNLSFYTKNADILIVCIGKANYITGDMVKDKVIVIDVGTNLVDGRLCGDVLFNSVKDKASYITPVPGGVGQVTTAVLFENIYNCYVNKKI